MLRLLRQMDTGLRHVKPWARNGIRIGVPAFLFLIVLYVAFGQEPVREWIGAFSGWAAAAGAIWIGMKTIRPLLTQNSVPYKNEKLQRSAAILAKIEPLVTHWDGRTLFIDREADFEKRRLIENPKNSLLAEIKEIDRSLREAISDLPYQDQVRLNRLHPDNDIYYSVSQQNTVTTEQALESLSNYLHSLFEAYNPLIVELHKEIKEIEQWKEENLIN